MAAAPTTLKQRVVKSLLYPRSYLNIQKRRSLVWKKIARYNGSNVLRLAHSMVSAINTHFLWNQLLSNVRRISGTDLVIRLMNDEELSTFGNDVNVYIDDDVDGHSGFHMILNPNILDVIPHAKTKYKAGLVTVDGWRCTSPKAAMLLVIEHELMHVLIRCTFPQFFCPKQGRRLPINVVKPEITFVNREKKRNGVSYDHRLREFVLDTLRNTRQQLQGHGFIFLLLSNSLIGHVGTHTSVVSIKPYVNKMKRFHPTFVFKDEETAQRDLIRCSDFD